VRRFSFRLENILKYRNHMEKKAQKDLLDARNEYLERENEVEGLASKRIDSITKCRNEAIRGVNVPIYKLYQVFLQKLDHDLEQAHMRLQKGKEKVEARAEILKGESIKKRALETLKDLQLRNFTKDMEQEEQKSMDEMIAIRKGGEK